jgi:UDP-3-O-[3-hydroxymyristoyl] glucosamine N-acyltransferase
VTKSIKKPGVYSGGVPLEPNEQWSRNYIRHKQLDKMARRLKTLEKRLGKKE